MKILLLLHEKGTTMRSVVYAIIPSSSNTLKIRLDTLLEGVPGVRVVELSLEGDRRVTVLWEAEPSAERRVLTCKRGGAAWEPRVGRPGRCPACKTPLWDQDRVRAPGGGRKE